MPRIDIAKVASVYFGRAYKCCCGCSGKHRYASQHQEWSVKNRGYAIDQNEVSDAQVKRIVNILNASPDTQVNSEYADAKVGNKCYIAYFVN